MHIKNDATARKAQAVALVQIAKIMTMDYFNDGFGGADRPLLKFMDNLREAGVNFPGEEG